ncbi:hypothetical protein ANRL2_00647 [Anaerolineae bacterium]|nr:hypothetical protein ANRL2_00647 [Anaerolineae bacterium]
MIYEPHKLFNVALALEQAFVNAIARVAVDYVRQQGKPWEYYVGYYLGGAALATGIPGANAILYVIGSGTVKIVFEKSPGAAQARVFLDGVGDADLDLADEIIDTFEHFVNIPNDGQWHNLQILNLGTIELEGATDWLSILAIESSTVTFSQPEFVPMAVFVVSASIQSAQGASSARIQNRKSMPIYIPQGALTLADIVAYHDAYLGLLDFVTGGVIRASQIILTPALPGTLKATAVANTKIQECGLLSFDLGNGYTDSVAIPAINPALVNTDGQTLITTGGAAVDDLVQLLLGAGTPARVASDRNGIEFTGLTAAKTAFRK